MSQLLEICDKNENMKAIDVKWDDFFDWHTFLSTLYKSLGKVKAYQFFTLSGSIVDGIVYCKASNLPNCEEFIEALNVLLTSAAKIQSMVYQSEALYIEQPGLKPVKEVGLCKNYGPIIPKQFHAGT